MKSLSSLDRLFLNVRGNRWLWLFSIFCRVILAFAFFAAGMVKVLGERFASGLSVIHPMGAYLEALHHTGYYYSFIGYAQILAAILLIIPRTVVLGALIYLPIIVNIWILSFAVRFEGSFVTAPLMVLANLYILCWNYDRIKSILPFWAPSSAAPLRPPQPYRNQFPWRFFAGVAVTVVLTIWLSLFGYQTMPRNSFSDCMEQFKNTPNEQAGIDFCNCIHTQGQPLDDCLENLEKSRK